MKKFLYLTRSTARQFSPTRYVCPNCGNPCSHLVARKYVVTQLRRCCNCFLMYRTPSDPPGREAETYEHDYAEGFTTNLPSAEQLFLYKKSNFHGSEKNYGYY